MVQQKLRRLKEGVAAAADAQQAAEAAASELRQEGDQLRGEARRLGADAAAALAAAHADHQEALQAQLQRGDVELTAARDSLHKRKAPPTCRLLAPAWWQTPAALSTCRTIRRGPPRV